MNAEYECQYQDLVERDDSTLSLKQKSSGGFSNALIRILGIGRFGEFSTLTFERLNTQLRGKLKRMHIDCGAEHVFAEYGGVKAVCVLRTYAPTNPGKRSPKYRLDLISPHKDVGLDLDRIAKRARQRYQIEA